MRYRQARRAKQCDDTRRERVDTEVAGDGCDSDTLGPVSYTHLDVYKRQVMETRLYGGVSSVEVVPPSGQDLEDVHQAYVAMAASGIVTEAQSAVFAAVSKKLLKESGVEAIMLGGTDLALAFNERDTDFPLIDCAGIHADAIAKLATT